MDGSASWIGCSTAPPAIIFPGALANDTVANKPEIFLFIRRALEEITHLSRTAGGCSHWHPRWSHFSALQIPEGEPDTAELPVQHSPSHLLPKGKVSKMPWWPFSNCRVPWQNNHSPNSGGTCECMPINTSDKCQQLPFLNFTKDWVILLSSHEMAGLNLPIGSLVLLVCCLARLGDTDMTSCGQRCLFCLLTFLGTAWDALASLYGTDLFGHSFGLRRIIP